LTAGDYVKVAKADGSKSEYVKIASIDTGNSITAVNNLVNTYAASDTAREVRDGVKVTVRNAGSVVIVVQTVYVYSGDTLIFKADNIGFSIAATKLGDIALRNSDTTWSALRPAIALSDTKKEVDVTFSARLVVSSLYKIRVVTDNGFVSEGSYSTPAKFE